MAVSMPTNIVQVRQRQYCKEFIHHLSISYGSLVKVETNVWIDSRLNSTDKDRIDKVLNKTAEIGRIRNGRRRSIQKKSDPEPRSLTPVNSYEEGVYT